MRAEVEQPTGASSPSSAELAIGGRDRVLVNKQRPRRPSELLDVAAGHRVLPRRPGAAQGRPGRAAALPRPTMVGLHPRLDADRRDLERILRHKATLLKQAGGRLDDDVALTLDVWNARLAEVG